MWIYEQPSQLRNPVKHSVYAETGQRKRQHHRKSQNGCDTCRKRRIKCDEAKPACAYCVKTKKTCCYSPVRASLAGAETSHSGSTQPACDAQLLNPSIQRHLLRALEGANQLEPELADFTPALRLHALESLNHFVTCDLSWLKAMKVQRLMQRPATGLVIDHQYLLHAILAVSAAHLAALKPDQKSYTIVARLHWQHSMRLYSPRFNNDFKDENVDAIYFAAQLHAILSFLFVRLPLTNANSRWTADWLVAMRYKWLLFNTPIVVSKLRVGMWQALVEAHSNWVKLSRHQLAANSQNKFSRSVQALLDYSDTLVSPRSWFENKQVQYLMMLERVPAVIDAIGAFLSFITEAPVEYITRLQEKGKFSLLLLLYWTMLLNRIDQWWLRQAADAERMNLLNHLSSEADDGLTGAIDKLVFENGGVRTSVETS